MSTVFKVFALAAAVAFPTQILAETFKRITNEADFRQMVVGKKVGTDANNWTVINADGSLDGIYQGKTMRGAWQWRGDFWCRNVLIDGREIGTDCQIMKISGSGIQNTRKQGKGNVVYNPFMN